MRVHSYITGMILAMVCCSYVPESTFGQAGFSSRKSSSSSKTNSSGNASGSQKQFSTGNTSVNRSVSFKKDGKKVSITENADGITVTIDGRSVKASNAADLEKKSPEAYQLYQERIGAATASATFRGSADAASSATSQSNSQGNASQKSLSDGGATGSGGASGSGNGESNASELLKDSLNQMRNENADNPQIRQLIDKMLQNVGK